MNEFATSEIKRGIVRNGEAVQYTQSELDAAVIAERGLSKADTCTYCGGRGPTHEREVVGPNESGNYTHEPTADYRASGGGPRFCSATPIFIRERFERLRNK